MKKFDILIDNNSIYICFINKTQAIKMSDYVTIYDPQKHDHLYDTLTDPAYIFDQESYPLQKYGYYCITKQEHLFAALQTGNGKTRYLQFAVMYWLKQGQRVICLAPVKTLSNQLYNGLKQLLDEVNANTGTNYTVGILTGDRKICPEANCIVMTSEILKNALYKTNNYNKDQDKDQFDLTDSISCIVIDELHFISDIDRGSVLEEIIILANPTIKFVMLSATVNNPIEFSQWFSRIKQQPINLILSTHRHVPLHHYIYVKDKLHFLMSSEDGKFHTQNYLEAKASYLKVQEERRKKGKPIENNYSLITEVVSFLKEKESFPAIWFLFSRKRCEQYANIVASQHNTSLLNEEEIFAVNKLFDNNMYKYHHDYENIKQYNVVRTLVSKGIAFHHSGLLGILKEMIEILFTNKLIKILFATTTVSVGFSAPTKSVIFSEFEKKTKKGIETLSSTEYAQCSGRAGRAHDSNGTVIIVPFQEFLPESTLTEMMSGNVQTIESKFSQNYNFVLKIPLSGSTSMEDFISKSLFSVGFSKQLATTIREYGEVYTKLNSLPLIDPLIEQQIKTYDKIENDRQEFQKKIGLFAQVKLSKQQLKDQKNNKEIVSKIPNFQEKYDLYCEKSKLQKQLNELTDQINQKESFINDNSTKIMHILMDLGYITKSNKNPFELGKEDITVKGILGSQINECNLITMTEIITNNLLTGQKNDQKNDQFDQYLSPQEIFAILAIFIDDGIGPEDELTLGSVECTDNVLICIRKINEIIELCQTCENSHGIFNNSFWKIRYDYVQVAYLWASGASINYIMDIAPEIYEGNFVRNMLKLNNIVHDVTSLCTQYGTIQILPVLEKIEELVIRDIVNVNSLYV